MELIAIKRAFHANALIEPGKSVTWPDDVKPPTWAVPKDKADAALEAEKGKPLNADLKPKAAQAAVRKKAAGASGE
jgi:hypothetical protein